MAREPDHARDAQDSERAKTRAAPDPLDLATEYIARLSAGEPVEKRSFLARLPDDSARAEFETLIQGADRVERSLPRSLSAGTVLSNRYRILSQIGGGGMGRVFAALDLKLERRVAVKVLASHNIGQQDVEDLFLKESKLLASLQHPGIVSVHEAGRDGDLAYIVMDLVDGTSLSDVIERARKELKGTAQGELTSPKDGRLLERAIAKKMPDGRTNLIDASDWYASVARIMLEVARTIEAAHAVRVIHRDLKPGNVMLVGGGHPVVLDFGLAGSSDLKPGTVTQGLYGSVAYLAPEQASSNQVGMDPRTDVYQLGLILYEMLTLQRAFSGTAMGEVLLRIKDGVFPAPRKRNPAVPRDLESICMMALELDPARRYASAKDLREDLERCVAGDEVPVSMRSDRWRTISRGSRYYLRRHPWAVGLTATLAASLVVWMITKMRTTDEMLRSAATAPLIAAFRLPRGAADPIPIRDGDPVAVGDSLGVTVSTNQPQYLYALSIFRRDGSDLYFAPMKAYEFAELKNEKRHEPATWVFEASPGLTERIYTKISDAQNKFEGLIVLAGAEKRNDLEEWLGRLDELITSAKDKLGGLPESEAWKEYTDYPGPPLTRGESPARMSATERQLAYRNLREAVKSKEPDVELPGLHRFKLECPVEKAK